MANGKSANQQITHHVSRFTHYALRIDSQCACQCGVCRSCCYAYSHTHSVADGSADVYTHSNRHVYSYAYSDADTYRHAHPNSYRYAHRYPYFHCHTCPANCHACPCLHLHGCARAPYRYVCPYLHAHTCLAHGHARTTG